jgi:hypothetical protein
MSIHFYSCVVWTILFNREHYLFVLILGILIIVVLCDLKTLVCMIYIGVKLASIFTSQNGGNIILYRTGFVGPVMAKKVTSSKMYVHYTGLTDLFLRCRANT